MATVREYYEAAARALNANREWHLSLDGKEAEIILGKISYKQEENTKYWSFYIPSTADLGCINFLLSQENVKSCYIDEAEPDQIIGPVDSPDRQSLSSFVFTRRVFLYIDQTVECSVKQALAGLGKQLNYDLVIRDQNYMAKCDELSRPLAFISHDSEDKDSLVRELVDELNKHLCPVWFDEYTLKVGDSLRESIESGLKEAKKCIVVLSPAFLKNQGWCKAEFDSIYTREIVEKNKVILPIWHGVSHREVYDYSSRLADRVALKSDEGIPALAKKLANLIMES